MTPWTVHRARFARLLGILLVLAGFAAVALVVGNSFVHGLPVAPPELPSAWVAGAETWLQSRRVPWMSMGLHGGLAFGLLGVAVMALGAGIARRQRPVLDALRSRREDAKRRVRQYQGDRAEPYIGPGLDKVG